MEPKAIFDPSTYSAEQAAKLTNVPGQSLGETNTPEQITAAGGTPPLVSSSTNYRTDVTKIGSDITDTLAQYGITKPDDTFDKYMTDYTKTVKDQEAELLKRNTEDVTGIKTAADNTIAQTKLDQADELAKAEGRTRIGGFFTQLEAKDIINLQTQHRLEIAALESKKQDAIQQANRAYQDGNYALAKDLLTEAKSNQQDIYNRKKDFYNYVTQAVADKRTATKQVRDDANAQIDKITKGIQDGTIDPKSLDPVERKRLMADAGYTFDIFDKIAEQAKNGQVVGSPHIDTTTGKVSLLLKKTDGTYEYKTVGQVSPSTTVTEAANKKKLATEKATKLAQIQTAFTTNQKNGGEAGDDHKIEPGVYRQTMEYFASRYGMLPSEFMAQLPPSRFLSADELKNNPDLSTSKSSVASNSDSDVETWAQSLYNGSITDISKVPATVDKTAVLSRYQELQDAAD